MHRALRFQKEVLEKGKVKPVNLIHGEEEFLIRTLQEKLRSIYGDNFSIAWGDEVSLEKLYEITSEGSVFSQISESAVFLYDFDLFLKRLGRKKKSLESLISLLKKLSRTKLFLVVRRRLTSQELSKEPFKTVSALGDVILADRLPKEKVKEIVRKKLEREAGGIEQGALELLVNMCGGDLNVLKTETEKLIVYSEGGKITEEVVKKVCTPWEGYDIFEFVDAFFEGNTEKSLRALKKLYSEGMPPLQIISALSGYAVKLLILQALLERGERQEKALESVGAKHQFTKMKLKAYLSKMPKDRLRKLVESLYRLDLSIKLYFTNPETALKKFTADFTLS